jgi:hypothetical protein
MVSEISERSWDYDNRSITAAPPRERDEMIAMLPAHFQGLVITASEYIGQFGSQPQ